MRVIDETVQMVEDAQFLITPAIDETENQGFTPTDMHRQFIFCRELEGRQVSAEPPAPPAGKVVMFGILETGKMVYKIKFPGGQVKILSQED